MRQHHIDNSRGLLMVLIVLGHSLYLAGDTLVTQVIYLFHVPAFFALSALLPAANTLPGLLHRGKRLLVPYAWGLAVQLGCSFSAIGPAILGISLLLLVLASYLPQTERLGKALFWILASAPLVAIGSVSIVFAHEPLTLRVYASRLFWGNTAHEVGPIWFLPALFVFSLLRFTLSKASAQWQWVWGAVLFLLGSFGLPILQTYHRNIPWGLDVTLLMAPLAVVMPILWLKVEKTKWQVLPRTIAYGASFIALLALTYYFIPSQALGEGQIKIAVAELIWPKTLLLQILALALPITLLIALNAWRNQSWLGLVGQHTLPILLFHVPLVLGATAIMQALAMPITVLGIVVLDLVLIGTLTWVAKRLKAKWPALAQLGLA